MTENWAVYALLGVYIWFMILGPLMKLLTHDPNKDKGIAQSRSRWFLQLLIGVVPLVLVGYNWKKLQLQAPPPPKQDLMTSLDTIRDKLLHPQVVYLPYPSTATPVEPVPAPVPPPPVKPAVPSAPPAPAANKI